MASSFLSSVAARKPASALPPARGGPLAAALCALALAAFLPGAQAAGNLLVNGDAEAAPGSDSGDVVTVPGWATTLGNFTVATYNPFFGGPDVGSPGPADRGLNYFAGGPSIAQSQATQLVDLSAFASAIATGQASYSLSGWFGGFSSQNDYSLMQVHLLDAQGNETEFGDVGHISAGDRSSVTGLLFRTASGFIPSTTTQALIVLEMNRTDGSYNDGYADNLSFAVQAVPEPASTVLMLAGLVSIGAWVRRPRS